MKEFPQKTRLKHLEIILKRLGFHGIYEESVKAYSRRWNKKFEEHNLRIWEGFSARFPDPNTIESANIRGKVSAEILSKCYHEDAVEELEFKPKGFDYEKHYEEHPFYSVDSVLGHLAKYHKYLNDLGSKGAAKLEWRPDGKVLDFYSIALGFEGYRDAVNHEFDLNRKETWICWKNYWKEVESEQGIGEELEIEVGDSTSSESIERGVQGEILSLLKSGSIELVDKVLKDRKITTGLIPNWVVSESDEPRKELTDSDLVQWIKNLEFQEGLREIILGEGGLGKTYTLFNIWKTVLNDDSLDIIPIYVPLREYNNVDESGKELFITSYIGSQYILSLEEPNEIYLRILRGLAESETRILLLLDGINEVTCDQVPLRKEIDSVWLKEEKSVMVMVSSRYDPRLNFRWNNFGLIQLQELDKATVNHYLQSNEIEKLPNNSPLLYALRTPMLVNLYVKVLQNDSSFSGNPLLAYKENVERTTDILWNYTESLLLNLYERIKYDEAEFAFRVFALKHILPALAYECVKSGKNQFEYLEFRRWINSVCELLGKENVVQAFPKFGNYFSSFDLGEKVFPHDTDRVRRISDIFENDLGLLKRSKEIFEFPHDDYRDYFAAVHIFNCFIITKSQKAPFTILRNEVFSKLLRQFVGELCEAEKYNETGKTLLEGVLEVSRGLRHNGGDYFNLNVIETIYQVRSSLSGIDLSNLDLTNILLREKHLSQNSGDRFVPCVLDKAKLNSECFRPTGHQSRIIKVFDIGQKVVVSVSNRSIFKWDRNGSEIGERLYFEDDFGGLIDATIDRGSKKIYVVSKTSRLIEFDYGIGEVSVKHNSVAYSFQHIDLRKSGARMLTYSIDLGTESHEIKDVDLTAEKRHVFSRMGFDWDKSRQISHIGYLGESSVFYAFWSDGHLGIFDMSSPEKDEKVSLRLQAKVHSIASVERSIIYEIAISTDKGVLILKVDKTTLELTGNLENQVQLNVVSNYVSFLTFGNLLALGQSEGNILIYDLVSQSVVQTLGQHIGAVSYVGSGNDGSTIISGDVLGNVKTWSLKTGQKIESFGTEKFGSTYVRLPREDITYYSNGVGTGSISKFYSKTDRRFEYKLDLVDVTAINSTEDDRRLILGTKNGDIGLFDHNLCLNKFLMQSLEIEGKCFFDQTGRFLCATDKERQWLYIYDMDLSTIRFQVDSEGDKFEIIGHSIRHNAFAVSHAVSGSSSLSNVLLVSVDSDNVIQHSASELFVGELIGMFQKSHNWILRKPHSIDIVDSSNYNPLQSIPIKGETGYVSDVALSNDENLIALRVHSSHFAIHDLENRGKLVAHISIESERDYIHDFQLTNDGTLLVKYGRVCIVAYSIQTQNEISSIKRKDMEIGGFAPIIGSSEIVLSIGPSWCKEVHKWNYHTNRFVRIFDLTEQIRFLHSKTHITEISTVNDGISYFFQTLNSAVFEWIPGSENVGLKKLGRLGEVRDITVSHSGEKILATIPSDSIAIQFDVEKSVLDKVGLADFDYSEKVIFDSDRQKLLFAKPKFETSDRIWFEASCDVKYESGLYVQGCDFRSIDQASELTEELIKALYFNGALVNINALYRKWVFYLTISVLLSPVQWFIDLVSFPANFWRRTRGDILMRQDLLQKDYHGTLLYYYIKNGFKNRR